MNIIFTNKELDKREIYKHTRAAGVSIKDCEDGAIIYLERVEYTLVIREEYKRLFYLTQEQLDKNN